MLAAIPEPLLMNLRFLLAPSELLLLLGPHMLLVPPELPLQSLRMFSAIPELLLLLKKVPREALR